MIDSKTIEQLRELSPKIKEIMAGIGGQVIFNCSKDTKHKPKVTLMLVDATEVEK